MTITRVYPAQWSKAGIDVTLRIRPRHRPGGGSVSLRLASGIKSSNGSLDVMLEELEVTPFISDPALPGDKI